MAVTTDDIAVELGRTAPAVGSSEYLQWQSWIDQALYLIGKRLGDVSLLNQTDVDYVVLMAVAAHARRPDDSTQVDIAVDDGRVSKRYESGSGRLTILPEWWELLAPALDDSESFTITPYGAPDPVDPWPLA